MAESEQDRKNREIVEAVRQTLQDLTERLTPEVEPALVYVLTEDHE